MKTIKNILTFLLLSGSATFAQDTLKNPFDYPLDDPRNPNCPCHKLQEQADKEFNMMQQQSANIDIAPQQRAVLNNRNTSINIIINQKFNDNNVDANMNNDVQMADAVIDEQQTDKEKRDWQIDMPEQRSFTREVGQSGGNGSYKKTGNFKKSVFRMQKKWNKTFHKRKKIRNKKGGCGCWST